MLFATALELVVAVEMGLGVGVGVGIVIVLAAALLIPYLVKEIRRGKVELGPRTPTGAGDTHPGRRGDPAHGHPEAQADPYEVKAQR